MYETRKKTMFIDESVFDFDPSNKDAHYAFENFLYFVGDARDSYDISLLTEQNAETLTHKINSIRIKEQLRQSLEFLPSFIKSWKEFEATFTDVIITNKQKAIDKIDDYNFAFPIYSITSPNYFHYFEEMYDESLLFNNLSTGKSISALTAHMALRDLQLDGKEIGVILSVENFGASDLLDIKPASGPSFYLPFTDDTVLDVDFDSGVITAELPKNI